MVLLLNGNSQGTYTGMLQDSLTHEIVKRITSMFNTNRIILFGSYASGQEHEESDIDRPR